MQRWLRMATAQSLRCGRPLWAGLRRGYILSSTSRQIRAVAHAAAVSPGTSSTREISATVGGDNAGRDAGGSALTPWYTIRSDNRHRPLRDCAYYANLLHYPKKEDYDGLAAEIFHHPPNTSVMSAVIGQLRSRGFLVESREMLKRPECLVWRHSLTCHFGKNRLQIPGEGSTPDSAYAAAFMGFMYQLHIFGWLSRTLEQGGLRKIPKPEDQPFRWASTDTSAKLHVHNFAARYLQTPEVVFEIQGEGSVKATVAIPNTDYIATATSEERRKSEFLAYAALKLVIESDLAQRDQAMDIRDPAFVSLDNARRILDLYRLKEPYGTYRRTETHVPGPQSATWTSLRLFWDEIPISDFHEMPTKKDANQLAALEAAIRFVKRNPSLLTEQAEIVKHGGLVPKRLMPSFASLSPDIVGTLGDCVDAAYDADLPDFQLEKYQLGYKPHIGHSRRTAGPNAKDRYHILAQSLASRSEELKIQQDYDRENPQLLEAMARRERLPIYQNKAQILAMVKNHDQCIVVGSTGSGKSTQVPQIILDDAIAEGRGALCNVICTQPRRIASVSLALTVCGERDRELGDIVGYRIGGDYENFSAKGGSITYCTTEILANELERAEAELPHNVSHIIIDEIHERSVHLDRLLSTIKMTFSRRLAAGLRLPKLILMSATVESDLFERYFEMVGQNGTIIRPPYLNVPGRMFQTTTTFLETFEHRLPPEMHQPITRLDLEQASHTRNQRLLPPVAEKPKPSVVWESAFEEAGKRIGLPGNVNAVAATIVHIIETTKVGSILAFVPGAAEIRSVYQALLKQTRVNLANDSAFQILMLHRANPMHLAEALEEVPENMRRIMISTNIAESSITFPDVDYVVDSGLRRDATDINAGTVQVLRDERISRANVLQRAGRAGRTKPGHYLGTFTTEEMQKLDVFPSSEDVTQNRLQGMYLRARIHFPAVPIQQFFDSFLTPIPPTKVQAAERHLQYLGAVTEDGDVSTIGYFLYRTTLEPALARMVLLGILFRCVDRAIVLACLLSYRFLIFGDSRFDDATTTQRRATTQHFAEDSSSDIIAQLRAYEEYRAIQVEDAEAARDWAIKHGLAYQYFEPLQARIRAVRKVLHKANFVGLRGIPDINAESENITILKMIICAGLYPNIAAHHRGPKFVTHQTLIVQPAAGSAALPGDYTKPETYDDIHKGLDGAIFCYKDLFISKSGSINYNMGGLTPISPLMLALFSSNVQLRPDRHNHILIDDSIPLKFSGDASAASVFLEFKKVFNTALLAGMQAICDVWPSNKRKALPTRLSDIILLAVEELIAYEAGQAKRRQDDVDRFSLGPEKEDWDGDDLTPVAKTWQPVEVLDSEFDEPSEGQVMCGICGQIGHDYDNCPNNTPQGRAERLTSHSSKSFPLDPSTDGQGLAAPWGPNIFDEENQELPELPSDTDGPR